MSALSATRVIKPKAALKSANLNSFGRHQQTKIAKKRKEHLVNGVAVVNKSPAVLQNSAQLIGALAFGQLLNSHDDDGGWVKHECREIREVGILI